MIKLIRIELRKIFHKKSPYILMIIMFLFCLLNNYLYKKDYTEEGFYKYSNQEYKNYQTISLEKINNSNKIIKQLSNKKLTKEEKIILQDAIAIKKENEYIIKKQININKENTINYQLRTITEDYELFLVILILIVASTCVCEEFTTGTIKLLLIKPFTRGKILISKYIACLITLMITIIFLIIIELLIGIPLLKADSLKWPVIIYHYGKKKIIEYLIWKYMLIRIIARIPFFIMLLTICFTISTYFTNTAISITLPMLIYLLDSIIKNQELKYTKYLINSHWHLENYLFGKHYLSKTNNLKLSLVIWSIYFIILSIITLHHFKRKNIKNI